MRWLATAALSFSAAIFLAYICIPTGWLIVPAVGSAVLAAVLALLRRKWLRPMVLALIFFALGLAEYAVYARCTVEKAEKLEGEELTVSCTVLEYPDIYDGYCRLRVRVDSGPLRPLKAIVYDYDRELADAEPGLKLRFPTKVRSAGELYGKPYDNYYVNGYFCKLTIRGDAERLGENFDLRLLPVRIKHVLLSHIETVFPPDTQAFLKALMLGDKQAFYDDDALYTSMTRAGLMHVVAVSGLHIAFLVGMLTFLLGNGRAGSLTSMLVVWLFVLMTGSGKAAVRAAVMQSFLLMAPLLRRENDPLTSLSAALALILAACPLAAGSVSLQLSFGAMAGILCCFPRIYRFLCPWHSEGLPGRIWSYIAAVLANSLSVMPLTVPLTAIHFGYVPLLAFVANFACLWAVSACFSLAWFSCLLAFIPGIGTLTAGLCALLVRYISAVCGLVAGMPHAVLYVQTAGSWLWMTACYALLLFAVFYRKNRLVRFALPALLSLSLLGLVLLRADRHYRTQDTMTVLNVGQGQCITAFAGDTTFMVDCGNINNLDNAGALAGEYLLSCGRKRVDVLLLTHLHADHANGVLRLLEMLPVDMLILPAEAEDPDGLREAILASARLHGAEVSELASRAHAERGRLGMDIFYLPEGKTENERCLTARLRIGETDMLITADAPQSMERQLAEREDLSGTEILIAGHHGSRDACAPELLREAGGNMAIVSVGYNTYGHPAEETLDRLRESGYTVWRTDLNGTVEIAVRANNGKENAG